MFHTNRPGMEILLSFNEKSLGQLFYVIATVMGVSNLWAASELI